MGLNKQDMGPERGEVGGAVGVAWGKTGENEDSVHARKTFHYWGTIDCSPINKLHQGTILKYVTSTERSHT